MRKGTGNLKSTIQGYSLSIRYGDPYEDSVSFVSEYCMIASFLLTLGLLGLTWATSDDYDEEQALRMWRLNSLSYCSQETLSKMDCDDCIRFSTSLSYATVISEPQLSLYGFVGLWEKEDIIIVFRASQDYVNFIENLSSPILTSFPVCNGCAASRTYLYMYASVRSRILSSIIALLREHPKAHILTTGHSLGSIFATFVAIDVKANVRHYDYNDYLLNPNAYTLFPNDTGVERGFYSYSSTIRRKRSDYDHNIQIASVYTFGMPRIGNSILADFIHSEIPHFYRITHGCDVVTLLPPRQMKFVHTGNEYWYYSNSNFYVHCPYPERKECINSIRVPNMDDHGRYMGELKGHCYYANRYIYLCTNN
ncbi:hypothetical protein WA171_003433 [Blastocystis sp. BT1]